MSLQAKLDALRENFENNIFTPQINSIMHEATAELVASGQAETALKAGDTAPDFSVPLVDGRTLDLASQLAEGPLVLTFYRGVWCPYCNADLQALQDAQPAIGQRGASLLALSPQLPVNSRKAIRENGLSFPIAHDAGNAVAAAFGLRFRLPDALIDVYKNTFGNDLAVVNGEPSWTLPMPARYVIDTHGVIAYAEVNPDYTQRPDPAELLPVLDRLKAGQAA